MTTIEESAKAYTELINRLEDVKDAIRKQNYGIAMDILYKPYPQFKITTYTELEEGEDERIRKGIYNFLYNERHNIKQLTPYTDEFDRWLAWLGKQGEQKQELLTKEKALKNSPFVEPKPANKVEPKFKVGDWVVRNGKTLQISGIDTVLDGTFHYWFTKGTWLSSKDMENAMLWTIQDAKDGDVLVDKGSIVLFKSIGNKEFNDVIDYYAYTSSVSGGFVAQKGGKYWGDTENCTLSPVTKEQREKFFAVMHKAGYEWDADKKELKKIEQKPWSKEDDNMIVSAEALCDDKIRFTDFQDVKEHVNAIKNWLKSIKERVQPQNNYNPYKAVVESIAEMCEKYKSPTSDLSDFLDNVKVKCKDAKEYDTLYPQSTWKPSKGQIKAVEDAIDFLGCTKKVREDLKSLREQLKKLREE